MTGFDSNTVDTLALNNRIEMFGPEVGEYVFRLESNLSDAETHNKVLVALLHKYREKHHPDFDSYECGGYYSNDWGRIGLCSLCRATDEALKA